MYRHKFWASAREASRPLNRASPLAQASIQILRVLQAKRSEIIYSIKTVTTEAVHRIVTERQSVAPA